MHDSRIPFDVNTITDEPPIPPRVAQLAKELGVNLNADRLLVERNLTHGSFEDNAAISQALKRIFRAEEGWKELTDIEREALDMIALKFSRVLSGRSMERQHWEDVVGYAKLVQDKCE